MDSYRRHILILHIFLGIFVSKGCSGNSGRPQADQQSFLQDSQIWSTVKFATDESELSFLVRLGDQSRTRLPSHTLNKSIYLGYSNLETSRIYASYGPFRTLQSLRSDMPNVSLPDFNIKAQIIDKGIQRHTSDIQVLFCIERKHLFSADEPTQTLNNIVLRAIARYNGQQISGSCSPRDGINFCVATIYLPLSWKVSGIELESSLQILYTVSVDDVYPSSHYDGFIQDEINEDANSVGRISMDLGDPRRYDSLEDDKWVWMYIPDWRLGINETFEIPIRVHKMYECTIRARARDGIKVTEVKYTNSIGSDKLSIIRLKGTFAIATVQRQSSQNEKEDDSDRYEERPVMMSMKFEVTNSTDNVRQISWRFDCGKGQDKHAARFMSRISTSQDWIKKLVPFTEKTDLANTAILTGKEVYQRISLLGVTYGGDVLDLTKSSRCSSTDPAILKVKPDCSGVYMNGSESGGSRGVDVIFSVNGNTVTLTFTVWVPELPVSVGLSDNKLSLVRKWKVLRENFKDMNVADMNEGGGESRGGCHLVYQRATIQVYAKFYIPASDGNSNEAKKEQKRTYFSGDNASQFITGIVRDNIIVKDESVAAVSGNSVIGLTPGVTKVQVINPGTGAILGETKLQVASDKVEISRLDITMVTGMSMEMTSLDAQSQLIGYSISALQNLFVRYQEAFLETVVAFDDGTSSSLASYNSTDYDLQVDSADSQVIAKSPDYRPSLPSLLAINNGSTTITVSLLLPQNCQRRKKENRIVKRSLDVNINFRGFRRPSWASRSQPENLLFRRLSPKADAFDAGIVRKDISSEYLRQLAPPTQLDFPNIPFDADPNIWLDEARIGGRTNYTVESYDEESDVTASSRRSLSLMEIFMYVLLALFGIAVIVFLINFILFVTRYIKRKKPSLSDGIHPQSWIMLGTNWEKRQVHTGMSIEHCVGALHSSTEGSSTREDVGSTVSEVTMERQCYEDAPDCRECESSFQVPNMYSEKTDRECGEQDSASTAMLDETERNLPCQLEAISEASHDLHDDITEATPLKTRTAESESNICDVCDDCAKEHSEICSQSDGEAEVDDVRITINPVNIRVKNSTKPKDNTNLEVSVLNYLTEMRETST